MKQWPELKADLATKIDNLPLKTRAKNALKADGINYIFNLVQHSETELRLTPNLGPKAVEELEQHLKSLGLKFSMEVNIDESTFNMPIEDQIESAKKSFVPESSYPRLTDDDLFIRELIKILPDTEKKGLSYEFLVNSLGQPNVKRKVIGVLSEAIHASKHLANDSI